MSKIAGNIEFLGGGQIKKLRIENLSQDPSAALLAGLEALIWFNSTDTALRYWDGAQIEQIAVGGTLEDYVRLDGTKQMLADLKLVSVDQSTSDALAAISKGYLVVELAKKQDTVTGAASTVVAADLGANKAVVSDAQGKIAESAVTSAEVAQLAGINIDETVQVQIDSKQDLLGYVPFNKAGDSMEGDIAMQSHKIIGLAKAVDPTSPVRLAEFDALQAGMNWKDDVDAVQVDATLVPETVEGKRYIITDIAALNEGFGVIANVANGDIVEYLGGAFVVAYDVSADPKAEGSTVFSYADDQFVRYENGSWRVFFGLDAAVAGIGLRKTGNVIDVNLGAGIAQLPSDEVGVDAGAGLGLFLEGVESTDTNAKLEVKVEGTTLVKAATGLKVAAKGITEVEVAASALGTTLVGGDGSKVEVSFAKGLLKDVDGKLAVDENYLDERFLNAEDDTAVKLKVQTAPAAETDVARLKEVTALSTAVNQAITALSTRVDASHVVYDGTAVAQAQHVVPHGLGQKYPTVQVVDENDFVITPDEIQFNNDSTLTVSVIPALKIRVIVSGVKKAAV